MTTILVIDAKKDNLITIASLLRELIPGCLVITAQSGLDGLEKAATESPNTILLEIKMPQMDGYEVCKRLKSVKNTKHIPIIMFTSTKSDSKSRFKGLEAGADAFLNKPIDEAELSAQINMVLRANKAENLLLKEIDLLEEMVQKRTKALKESEVEKEIILDSMQEQMVYLAPDLRILWANNAASESVDLSPQELKERYCYEVWNRRCNKFDDCPAQQTFKTGRPYQTEIISSDKRAWIIRSYPVHNETGKVKGAVEVAVEITEHKKAEQDKAKLEARLLKAQKMEAIGTLAGGIAHDFNNILFPIIGYTEMSINNVPEDNMARDNLKEVLKAANRAKGLVQQILTFSRQGDHERSPLLLQPILKETLKLLRASLPTTIEMRHNISNDCGAVLADPGKIQQVFMNLCTNAYHAMREKGGVLEVTLTEEDIGAGDLSSQIDLSPGSYLKLTVSDTGHGIEHADMERIFEPYFTTNSNGEGTGMGLAVVHGIIQSYQGKITAHSNPGQGTSFKIYLPLSENNIDEMSAISTEQHVPTGNENILLVDDEEQLAQMMRLMLERLGYRVTSKTRSIEALESFSLQPENFDLVITDQTMPQMTGIELAERLILIRPDIPIILCTGFSEVIKEDKTESLGIEAYFSKPIHIREMAEKIRNVLDRK